MRDVRELMLQERREEKEAEKGRRDYAMIECVVRAMGRRSVWEMAAQAGRRDEGRCNHGRGRSGWVDCMG